jgi:hypothetical protein
VDSSALLAEHKEAALKDKKGDHLLRTVFVNSIARASWHNAGLPRGYGRSQKESDDEKASVDGVSGSFDFVEFAEVFPVDPPEVALKGRMLIRSGTGELEGIRGFLNTTWVKGSPTELSGWIRLEHEGD